MDVGLKSKRSFLRIAPYLIFAIIFFSNDTLLFGTNKQVIMQKIGQIIDVVITLTLPVMFYRSKNRCSLKVETIALIFIMTGCVLMSSAVNHDFRPGVIFRIVLIVLGMEIAEAIPLKEFCIVFSKIIIFFAGCSVFGMIILRVVPGLSNFSFLLANSENYRFWNFIIYMQEAGLPVYARNYGIFREPGVFQMYLIVAMMIVTQYWNWKQRRTKLSMFILLLALLMTKSTTGYFTLLLFVIFYLSKKGFFSKRKKIQWLIAGLLLLLTAMFLSAPFMSDKYGLWISELLRKFDRTNSGYASFYARYSSITVNLILWMKNPMFGIGLTNHDGYFAPTALRFYGILNGCNTNTLLSQFAAFGIVFGTVWIISLAAISYRFGKNYMQRFLAFLILTILLVTENVSFSPIWNIFMCYGLTLVRMPEKAAAVQIVRRITFAKEADCIHKSW